jgi:hypothetical protein
LELSTIVGEKEDKNEKVWKGQFIVKKARYRRAKMNGWEWAILLYPGRSALA